MCAITPAGDILQEEKHPTTVEGEDQVCEAVQNYSENYARKRADEFFSTASRLGFNL